MQTEVLSDKQLKLPKRDFLIDHDRVKKRGKKSVMCRNGSIINISISVLEFLPKRALVAPETFVNVIIKEANIKYGRNGYRRKPGARGGECKCKFYPGISTKPSNPSDKRILKRFHSRRHKNKLTSLEEICSRQANSGSQGNSFYIYIQLDFT